MNKNLLASLLILLVFPAAATSAQETTMTSADRARWLSSIREYKHEFISKDLDLTKEQQRDFFPLYDQMEDEVEQVNHETRENERRLSENADATDLELENGARTLFEQKRAEGQIEMTYFEKFKEILTPRQLLKLKNSERKFNQQLVNHHRRISGKRQGR